MKNNICLGIDLGTTYSCVAYINEDGKAQVIKNSEGNLTTPSVVYFDDDSIVVGELAKENARINPENHCAFIKTNIGKKEGFFKDGENISPEEISAYILAKIVKDAKETLVSENVIDKNTEIKDVVITCPAYFGINERTATKSAGEIAGLNVLNIINEPTAAAIAYGLSEENKTVMVYDLGGGTCDITIIKINDEEIEVIATSGDHNLGGKDIDDAIFFDINNEFCNKNNGKSFADDPDSYADVLFSIEKAKKKLTNANKASITIRSTQGNMKYELTRDHFEKLVEPVIQRSIFLVEDAIEMAIKKSTDLKIDEIILVGGSTKSPIIEKSLLKFGKNIKSFDPDESVAKGAAIFAYKTKNKEKIIKELNNKGYNEKEVKEKIKSSNIDNVSKELDINKDELKFLAGDKNVKNVSSRTFGVIGLNKNKEEKLFNIIMRNDKLPITANDKFNLVEEGQTQLIIRIMESITTDRVSNIDIGNQIGELILDVPNQTTVKDIITVEFKLEENGLLTINAKVKDKEVSTKLDTKDLITEKQKSEAMLRVEQAEFE